MGRSGLKEVREALAVCRLRIVIPEDHRVVVQVPEDIPAGPAELIVLLDQAEENEEPMEPSPEEALQRFKALAAELAADPRPFAQLSFEERRARLRRVLGIGRGLFSPGDEFAQRKQEEIGLEERRFGR